MKIKFDIESFEDYLFKAIQYARSLNTIYADEDEVLRYLRLAQAEVDLFVKRSRKKEDVSND